MGVTVLTQFSQASDATSVLTTRGRGYIHAQFRAGSAVSSPSVVLSTMSMVIALQMRIPGDDNGAWCDVQTWAVAVTESMPGRDLSYFVSEPGLSARLAVKNYGSGLAQARLWEG